jgi:cyclophilin family peptidyl-prolyl cis-trans isomerase
MNTTISLAVLLGVLAANPQPERKDLQSHRVLLRTVAGDIVFAVYPHVALENSKQLINMVAHGFFTDTHFHRVEPGFVLQHAGVRDRRSPLTNEQIAMLKKLPAERSTAKHVRGVISMARDDGDPNSAESSFSIILGSAPHLDGNYTIIGEVIDGWDVIEMIEKMPLNKTKPISRLTVNEAWYVQPGQELGALRKAVTDFTSVVQTPEEMAIKGERSPVIVAFVGLIMLIMCFQSFFSAKLSPSRVRSLGLLCLFIGGFLLLILVVPLAHVHNFLGVALFLGALSLFKILGQFENS